MRIKKLDNSNALKPGQLLVTFKGYLNIRASPLERRRQLNWLTVGVRR